MDAARLFEEHHAGLYRYLLRLTGDADLAQDAAQEAFVRLLAKRPREDRLRGWLFTVATNVVRARSNERKRRRGLLEAAASRAPSADPPRDPAELAIAEERRRYVRRALDQLSEKERAVLLMREEGFSHREIAEAVGTTTGSVGTMIARALDRLAGAMAARGEAL
jgi:RNA polymerase sigma-70 factor (ECF subfamily)